MERRTVREAKKNACRWTISGRVQGVGFRAFVVRAARRLGLDGYVRNTEDGTVEIWAEGPMDTLDRLDVDLTRGPSRSQISGVERVPGISTEQFHGFEVRG